MLDSDIPTTEALTIEFKSDQKRLPDKDLVLAAVCLANTDGGLIYLGVEDDGQPTGLHPDHHDLNGLAALIANRTIPPLSVRTVMMESAGLKIARIEIPRSTRLVATSDGTLQRRRLLADGKPQCVPFLPHEFASRESDLRLSDYSALPVAGADLDTLDPAERHRLRQAIERYRGDRSLLGLDDAELDGALGLTRTESGQRVPTVAGLLLIGRESAIRAHLPTHEAAFQVLDGTEVRVNDFYRWPLVRLFERVEEQFLARVSERELQVGLFRVPVPNVEPRAFREALVNALTHRDYSRLGAVQTRWQTETLSISSPGGFVEGVSLDNLLVVEPRPRNPLLADAFKRIGLAERTGRGVDLIYQGLLRYGRPPPSYLRSDPSSVSVDLNCAEADLNFLKLVLEQENQLGTGLPIESLLVLAELRHARRLDTPETAKLLQRDSAYGRAVLERLVEAGLLQAHGVRKGRTYTLSAAVYRQLGSPLDYVRQAGFDPLQQEEMVKRYVREHGNIRRSDVIRLCGLSPQQATRLLKKLNNNGILEPHGEGKGTVYARGPNL
ncbi:DNA glycosylase AlkZ-like family protein [Lamprocystis purpurea]|uniref:DNA glycosylase AlkZ-like family protein n=1 Tax=Lamprocystis purpurea TaxID=61598 RepID=UPI0003790C8C|nr:crosslink repair DNA glycosylase YcaQ family protein [Lamprocystis purpurea]